MFKGLNPKNFTAKIHGKEVKLFMLQNENGMIVEVTNYGARVLSCWVPNKDGELQDVVLGYDHIDDYVNDILTFHGCTVGRFANRINRGRFSIGDDIYQVPTVLDTASLHSAPHGFDSKVWEVSELTKTSITFNLTSSHLEGGYPGEVIVMVKMTVTDYNELDIQYKAETDRPTILNLTNHSYFSLNNQIDDILHTKVQLNADFITKVDAQCIPTGELYKVVNTPFDFKDLKAIGQDIQVADQQLEFGGGYDHNFVLNKSMPNAYEFAAKAVDHTSGIIMSIWTTEPGVQFYTSNFLNADLLGKNGRKQYPRGAFCLETQHFPDSPNHKSFPSTIYDEYRPFLSRTTYRFEVVG